MHDRLSALAALTVSPKRQHRGLSLRFQPHIFQALQVADFLRALVPQLRGPIIVLWDRGSTPRGPAIAAGCQAHPRLHLAAFPAYAPARNPTAQVGNDVTGHLATACGRTHGISAVACRRLPAGSGARRRSGGRSSAVPRSHPPREHIVIAYAKLNKDGVDDTPQLIGHM
jgi:hypothetical protein